MREAPGPGHFEPLTIVLYATRDRSRTLARQAFPRRHVQLLSVRSARDLAATFRRRLVDAALVDLGAPSEDLHAALALAREFPSAPFVALTPLRPSDSSLVARAAAQDFADVAVEGVDDGILRPLVESRAFTRRFAEALAAPPEPLKLSSPMQLQAWRVLVSHGGRPVLTETIAAAVGVTREHLSRAFSQGEGPNIKRVIDLVRLVAAAELSKNPGFDVGDVANVLGFASSSHLSTTATRIAGTRPTSLARLRAIDLIERFAKDRGRSRQGQRRGSGSPR